MIELSSEIKLIKNGLLNFEGSKFLFDLYLPLIGSDATFLYLFFANKVKKEEDDSTLEKLVNESQLNLQNFLLAKKTLESIGLISFFKKKNEEKYLLIVTDVLTPKNFFNNLTLKGLFCQRVGSEEAEKILKKYEIKRSYKDYENISAKINDSFTIDFNPDFLELNKGMELEGYNKNEIRDDFSLVKFLNYLKKETQIRVNSISDEELDYIKRIATLYGLKEKDIGGILTECFIPEESKGNKVDQAKLKNIKLNLKQLLYFAEFKILYQDIKIFISLEDFTTSENREIRKLEKSIKDEKQRRIHTYNERMQEINELKDELKKNENNPHNVERIKERLNKSNESLQKFNNRQEQKIRIKEEEAVKYLMDIVVKKLKKNSLQQSIIDSLKLKFDENDFYHSYFFYS